MALFNTTPKLDPNKYGFPMALVDLFFPMVSQWFSYGFPKEENCLWFSYDFPMVFLFFPMEGVRENCLF